MALHIVRFESGQGTAWGVLTGTEVRPLDLPCTTTAELLAQDYHALPQVESRLGAPVPLHSVNLLSPITTPAKVLCQGANYRQHMIDSGMDPDAKHFNMFFTKSSAAITAPVGEIVRPAHVSLLDYEIELTLVLRRQTRGPVTVTPENLHEYVAGICIGNDVSARDVQLPQMQFHKAKSYRTFCPLGPVLCLLAPDEMHHLDNLMLQTRVNGVIRQTDNTRNMVFKPAETLTEYSQIADFEPGDVLMTGTPSGCALSLPSTTVVKLTSLLPEARKWELFKSTQQRRWQYLQPGDRLTLEIRSSDGRIDLGRQEHLVVQADA